MRSFSSFITESVSDNKMKKNIEETISFLEKKNKVLFLTTSNRYEKNVDDIPKSTQLAYYIQELVGMKKIEIIEVPKLKIYNCEGNVSSSEGNGCGKKEALLKDENKNPSGYHRCWCSLHNKDDELWKISKSLFESDCVLFFGSVRWGQTNSIYQKLIERLCWIENRHTTLKENNIVKNINAGIILIGQNWNGSNVIETQKQVLKYYGFEVSDKICWNWQYTSNSNDESKQSYKNAIPDFQDILL
jgi:multimeric flavodoxin WrbA